MIDDKRKLLHFEIPRTGSTSMYRALRTVYHNSEERHHSPSNLWTRLHSGEPLRKVTSEMMATYWKFTFVRNPFDRLVSVWRWGPVGERYRGGFKDRHPDFNTFVRAIAMTFPGAATGKKRFERWWLPQAVWLRAEFRAPNVDFIGRFERIHEDYDTLRDKLVAMGHERPPGIGHFNKSTHNHYSTYYTDESVDIATRYYARDLELFGYEFEDKR